jgi:hypothetical protein
MEDDFEDPGFENPKEARFNMAIDTLMRLGNLLREIKDVYQNTRYSDEGFMQYIKYKLVRTFFIQSIPLLPSKHVEDLKRRVFNLKPKMSTVIERRFGDAYVKKGLRNFFSQEFEDELDDILINIQIILKDEGMFMPSKDDSDLF